MQQAPIREVINPWSWQEPLGFVHCNKVTGANTVLTCPAWQRRAP